jgi:hypothetical protein
MLRRTLLVLLVAVGTLMFVAVPAANADCVNVYNPETGEYELECSDGGDDGGGDDGGGGDGAGSSTCSYGGNEIPCTGPSGSVWSSAHACYVGDVWDPGGAGAQPPPGQTTEDGAWHICYFPPPGSSWEPMWIQNGTVTIDPVVLANRAIAAMDLDPIKIGIVPESGPNRVGLVGLPVWMWVHSPTDDTFGPITASASEGSVSVSATASVSNIVWNMGDGSTVTCTGKGTPYADHYGKQDSPTCGHRYEKMSTDQLDGAYQVTATSHWVVEWAGGGQSGTIEFDLTTDALPIRVGEAQVLTQ